MKIPRCYDPIKLEERRQMEMDKYAESLICCTLCGTNLYPGTLYREACRQPVCEDCFRELAASREIVE